jgi:predicted nucleic-acid-binding protein
MIDLIDTNIILRYLVGDDENLYQKAKQIFEEAKEGKREIHIKVVIIAECCYVLESFYKKNKHEIADSMEIFLSQKWLKVEDRSSLLSMWHWYRENLHFVDSYLLACSKQNKSKIITFDKELNEKLQDYLD